MSLETFRLCIVVEILPRYPLHTFPQVAPNSFKKTTAAVSPIQSCFSALSYLLTCIHDKLNWSQALLPKPVRSRPPKESPLPYLLITDHTFLPHRYLELWLAHQLIRQNPITTINTREMKRTKNPLGVELESWLTITNKPYTKRISYRNCFLQISYSLFL